MGSPSIPKGMASTDTAAALTAIELLYLLPSVRPCLTANGLFSPVCPCLTANRLGAVYAAMAASPAALKLNSAQRAHQSVDNIASIYAITLVLGHPCVAAGTLASWAVSRVARAPECRHIASVYTITRPQPHTPRIRTSPQVPSPRGLSPGRLPHHAFTRALTYVGNIVSSYAINLILGFAHPRVAAGALTSWVVSRIAYTAAYVSGEPCYCACAVSQE
ncbi:hypothetical protein DFH09DRAFT_1147867 [Mycena vulgaris]|nr:hypothetical protein DFH09DRAFT_1147867 [Mycena vulgaris]